MQHYSNVKYAQCPFLPANQDINIKIFYAFSSTSLPYFQFSLSLSVSLSLLDILTACLIKSNHAVAKQGRVMQKDFVGFDISSSDVISSFVCSDVNGEIVCSLVSLIQSFLPSLMKFPLNKKKINKNKKGRRIKRRGR